MQTASQRGGMGDIRVVLADDHALFRSGLHELLAQHGVDVAGEAEDAASALEVVRETAPDVVLMDVNMPGMSGIEATMRIRAVALFFSSRRRHTSCLSDWSSDVCSSD